jgi:hypothetical protein
MNTDFQMHIHLTRNGGVLVLVPYPSGYRWQSVPVASLEKGLQELKQKDGVISYSRDDPEADPPAASLMIFKIIETYKIPMQLLKEPRFPLPT